MLMMGAIGLLLVGGDAQELFFERQKQVFKKNQKFPSSSNVRVLFTYAFRDAGNPNKKEIGHVISATFDGLRARRCVLGINSLFW